VPASLELELGVLEPELVARYRSIGSENALVQLQFLSNHVSQVHLFRQRIPGAQRRFFCLPMNLSLPDPLRCRSRHARTPHLRAAVLPRPSEQAVALVITLLLLSVITFMAVTFLVISRS
jgi:hypothetical protein